MVKRLKRERLILITCLVLSMILHLAYGIEGMNQTEALEQQIKKQAAQLRDKQEQIEVLEIIIENQKQDASEPQDEPEYIGTFEITYYTAGPESTGKSPGHPAYGITRSGTTVEEGRTIAADWSVLEPGTKVYIEGVGERIVEDTGGLIVGECIDVYVEDVEVALERGRHTAKVWVVGGEPNEILY